MGAFDGRADTLGQAARNLKFRPLEDVGRRVAEDVGWHAEHWPSEPRIFTEARYLEVGVGREQVELGTSVGPGQPGDAPVGGPPQCERGPECADSLRRQQRHEPRQPAGVNARPRERRTR